MKVGFLKVLDGLKEENVHYKWSPANKYVFEVEKDEIFQVKVPDSSMGQITSEMRTSDLRTMNESKFDGVAGPVMISDAKPGDTLEIEIIDIGTSNWGWSSISGMLGLLKGEFDDRLVIWDIHHSYCTAREGFLKNIRVPKNPFLGIIGLSPSSGEYGMIPPRYFGGNMDNRLLTRGSKLYLPVSVEGGMISFGDLHASQGDGEVCGTAIETSGKLTVKIAVLSGNKIPLPRASAQGYYTPESIVTMGIGSDLIEASKSALREMIDDLERTKGLTKEESYVLCSVAGNLHISEIVDEPNFVVSLSLPKDIF